MFYNIIVEVFIVIEGSYSIIIK